MWSTNVRKLLCLWKAAVVISGFFPAILMHKFNTSCYSMVDFQTCTTVPLAALNFVCLNLKVEAKPLQGLETVQCFCDIYHLYKSSPLHSMWEILYDSHNPQLCAGASCAIAKLLQEIRHDLQVKYNASTINWFLSWYVPSLCLI